jgi:hypothetical protein
MNHLEPKNIPDVKAQLGRWLLKRVVPNIAGFANVMIAYKSDIRKEPWATHRRSDETSPTLGTV